MTINLDDLLKAADRFANYDKALAKAMTDPQTQAERAAVAERHRKVFLPAAERLLKVQGDDDLRPIRFLHIALLAARAVGRIRISDSPATEEGDATGFLVAPGLLMTNWHVLKTEDFAAAGSVIFDDEDGLDGDPMETKSFRLRPDLLFVNDETLDYAIVAVSPRTSSGIPLSQFGYLRLYRQTGKLDPTQRQAANIIQHPGGGPKKIALRDNDVLPVVPDSVDPQKNEISLFYGTDTLKGSSGSPVCSDQWYVVALHRGGVPKTELMNGQRVVLRLDGTPAVAGDSRNAIRYVANEGMRVSRIYHSLEEKAKAATNPDAAAAAVALERIGEVAGDPRMGPISQRTTPLLLPALPPGEGGRPEEITRRSSAKFEDAEGYRPTFLGDDYLIPLPRMTSEVKRELAPLKNTTETELKAELKYDTYSIVMNRERRTAFFAAGNIDGSQLWGVQGLGGLPKRPKWSWDPRMDERFQPDDTIFSSSMQRGHLFKRQDAVWGADENAMRRADEHSFTIPNATPMIADFNNVEWGDLEDIITRECEAGHKVSYFAGPVFRSTDRFFNELRLDVPASERRKGMRVPESFWKIVAWVEDSHLKAAGFMLYQTDEIERHGPIVEVIDFGKYRQVPIGAIEQATGLRFQELKRVDTY
ncbi:MAG: DNA/RNA non-specific endonuclease [Chloroflexi bacterium]|nr:DNA/RNA non-specific endonuclease [Chloroflexota bacterium]